VRNAGTRRPAPPTNRRRPGPARQLAFRAIAAVTNAGMSDLSGNDGYGLALNANGRGGQRPSFGIGMFSSRCGLPSASVNTFPKRSAFLTSAVDSQVGQGRRMSAFHGG
jgi:hypothetical protein